MQRDKNNNDDKKIQTPLQSNDIDEKQEVEEVAKDLEMHLFGDEISLNHLTQNEYEDSLNAQAGEGPNNILCNTDQHGYNLRSKSTPVTRYFGHSGDVSISDVFRVPQGIFS